MCDVELIYGPEEDGKTDRDVGDVWRESTVEWQEVPIDDSRLISSGLYSAPQIAALAGYGYQTVGIGGIDYSYGQMQDRDTWTWTEANIVGSVGQVTAPTGVTSPTTGKWMCVGRSLRDVGDAVEQIDRFKYNVLGWQ
jgi:hypothetical protein